MGGGGHFGPEAQNLHVYVRMFFFTPPGNTHVFCSPAAKCALYPRLSLSCGNHRVCAHRTKESTLPFICVYEHEVTDSVCAHRTKESTLTFICVYEHEVTDSVCAHCTKKSTLTFICVYEHEVTDSVCAHCTKEST